MIVSLRFILFLLLVLISYYVIPGKCKKFILLVANILFYSSFGFRNLWILSIIILISYFLAQKIRKCQDIRLTLAGITVTLLPLILLKYTNVTSLVEPIGISFFTFKVISYLADTYKGKMNVEHKIWDYAIYVSFFPAITSGPIDRADDFLKQMCEVKKFKEKQFLEGLLCVLWGYFQKMIIADRLAITVGTVFENYQNYAGFPLFATSILYTLQIYFDFAGYTCIACGIAKALGYECQKNFKQPYFSRSIREFWQRWHMSLSGWLRDYVYIPLGGNRKGITRKYINLMFTFLVSGIWHGAGWNFVVWGVLHGVYQVVGALTENVRSQIKVKLRIRNTIIERTVQTMITFMLVNFAWVLFRADGGLIQALDMIKSMFVQSEINFYWLWNTGIVKIEFLIMLVAVSVALVADILEYCGTKLSDVYFKCPLVVRFAGLYILFFAIIIFGVYGPGYDASSFIYFQF